MKMYHQTSPEKWDEIQEEGVLWGKRNAPSRCTYLAAEIENAIGSGGGVILEIEYNPKEGVNNYVDGCWQVREYEPIPLSKIKKI